MANIDISIITLEDIPEGIYRELAEKIGIGNLLAVARVIGGAEIYFLSEQALTRPIRDKLIIKEFNGFNNMELARKYGITRQRIRQILKNQRSGG